MSASCRLYVTEGAPNAAGTNIVFAPRGREDGGAAIAWQRLWAAHIPRLMPQLEHEGGRVAGLQLEPIELEPENQPLQQEHTEHEKQPFHCGRWEWGTRRQAEEGGKSQKLGAPKWSPAYDNSPIIFRRLPNPRRLCMYYQRRKQLRCVSSNVRGLENEGIKGYHARIGHIPMRAPQTGTPEKFESGPRANRREAWAFRKRSYWNKRRTVSWTLVLFLLQVERPNNKKVAVTFKMPHERKIESVQSM